MPSERPRRLRLLLDEHYPGWLADALNDEGLDVVLLTADRPVSTFGIAASHVQEHLGIVYCHHARFPRRPVSTSSETR